MEIKKTVDELLDYLCDRHGFDDWWFNLDPDIQNEIVEGLEDIVRVRTSRLGEVPIPKIKDEYGNIDWRDNGEMGG